jgi:hypothetical protein
MLCFLNVFWIRVDAMCCICTEMFAEGESTVSCQDCLARVPVLFLPAGGTTQITDVLTDDLEWIMLDGTFQPLLTQFMKDDIPTGIREFVSAQVQQQTSKLIS